MLLLPVARRPTPSKSHFFPVFLLWSGWSCLAFWLPILYHALYGFYIWYRGDSNVAEYPWTGNWMYTAQRYTGGITFAYIIWHTWHLRFSGVHLLSHPRSRIRQGTSGISESVGCRLLCSRDHLRFMAFRLWIVAVRREVGDHAGRSSKAKVWLCVHGDWAGFLCWWARSRCIRF